MPMRLYDTARPRGRAVRAGPGRHHVHVRHHAVRRDPPRPRRRLPDLRRAAAPAARPGPRHQVRAQHHRRRRPAVRQGPRARRALPRPGGRRGGPVRPRHGRARRAAVLQRAAGHVRHRRHPRLHRHGARPGLRLPGRRRGVLRRLPVPDVRLGEPLRRGDDAGATRPSGAATPTTPTSATRSTSCCGSRRRTTSRRGSRCGARAGRAGTSSARRWPCASSAPPSTSTAAAPT